MPSPRVLVRPQAAISALCAVVFLSLACAFANAAQVYDVELDKKRPPAGEAERYKCDTDVQCVERNWPAYIRGLSRGIGRVTVDFSDGTTNFCTGTLIAVDAVLTAYHCLVPEKAGAKIGEEILFDPGWREPTDSAVTKRPGQEQVGLLPDPIVWQGAPQRDVAKWPDGWDFVILPVNRPPKGQTIEQWKKQQTLFAQFTLGDIPAGGGLEMVHQPDVPAFGLQYGHCAINAAGTPDRNVIRHTCRTAAGSSGALLLQDGNAHMTMGIPAAPKVVVGIHAGICSENGCGSNLPPYGLARPIKRILSEASDGIVRLGALKHLADFWDENKNNIEEVGGPSLSGPQSPHGSNGAPQSAVSGNAARFVLAANGSPSSADETDVEYPGFLPRSTVVYDNRWRATGYLLFDWNDKRIDTAPLVPADLRNVVVGAQTWHREVERRTSNSPPKITERWVERIETRPLADGILERRIRSRGAVWSSIPGRVEWCQEDLGTAYGPIGGASLQTFESYGDVEVLSSPKRRCGVEDEGNASAPWAPLARLARAGGRSHYGEAALLTPRADLSGATAGLVPPPCAGSESPNCLSVLKFLRFERAFSDKTLPVRRTREIQAIRNLGEAEGDVTLKIVTCVFAPTRAWPTNGDLMAQTCGDTGSLPTITDALYRRGLGVICERTMVNNGNFTRTTSRWLEGAATRGCTLAVGRPLDAPRLNACNPMAEAGATALSKVASMQCSVTFGFNKCNITAEADAVLREAAAVAQAGGSASVRVSAQAHIEGTSHYGRKLAGCRIGAVKSSLVGKGSPANKIDITRLPDGDAVIAIEGDK